MYIPVFQVFVQGALILFNKNINNASNLIIELYKKSKDYDIIRILTWNNRIHSVKYLM